MVHNVAVVREARAKEQAYRLGYSEFDGAPSVDGSLGTFRQTARWANIIAPKLRAAAGYDDAGHGTYQEDRKVAVVAPGDEDDEPADAELVDSRYVYDDLMAAFDAGARAAREGMDYEHGIGHVAGL